MAKGGKYFNPEKAAVQEQLMAKVREQTELLQSGDTDGATALSADILALQTQLESKGRRNGNVLNVTPEEALAMEIAENEAVVIVRTSVGSKVSKSTLNKNVKNKRVSTDVESIWPFATAEAAS